MFGFCCPVCSLPLTDEVRCFRCENGHSFDKAKEGYVNLLVGSRPGSLTGDSADMAKSRRAFLSKGYFDTLCEELCRISEKYGVGKRVLDICCGEGHYSSYYKNRFPSSEVLGFDLSREMVKRASKQNKNVRYAVANMTAVPVESNTVDCAFHLFAPFYSREFSRLLTENGILISVVAGERHLYEMKELIYDEPYPNEVKDPSLGSMRIIEEYDLTSTVYVEGGEDLNALFSMTPYCRHTPKDGLERLNSVDGLSLTLSFHIFVYGK